MPYYLIKFKDAETGKIRQRNIWARSEEEAVSRAEYEGIVIHSIIPEKPDTRPPSEAQLDFAHDLQIAVPEGASCRDVSELISGVVDKPVDEFHVEMARTLGIKIPGWMTTEEFLEALGIKFNTPGREEALAAWFVFHSCRFLLLQAGREFELTPESEEVRGIARILLQDESLLVSMRKLANVNLDTKTASDGTYYYAVDGRNPCFREARKLIRATFDLTEDQPSRPRTSTPSTMSSSTHKGSGCLGIFTLGL